MPVALPLPTRINSNQSQSKVRILSTQFGMGYKQMTPNGTNPLYNEYTLTWMSLNQTDRNTVIAALQSGYGCDYYTWTRPGDSSDTKWIILSDSSGGVVLYDEIIEEAGFYRITVHLRQIP